MNHWNPERALRRIKHTHVGGYHVTVREADLQVITNGIHAGIAAGITAGKARPENEPQPVGTWLGGLWVWPKEISRNWGTLYALQAPRIGNFAQDAIGAFDNDSDKLTSKDIRGVLPLLIVTEVSHTARCINGYRNQIQTDFYDPSGPDSVQKAALNRGICVLRTSQEALAGDFKRSMEALHKGEIPWHFIIP